jgi:hypothetical protein
MPYTTGSEVLAEVKTDLTTDCIEDTLVPEAEAVINAFCRHDFNLHSDVSEILDGEGDTTLVLSNRPVISVKEVLVGGLALLTDDFYLRGHTIVLAVGRFPVIMADIAVTYTWGYSAVPADVSRACRLLVADWIIARQMYQENKAVDSGYAIDAFTGYIPARAYDQLTTGNFRVDNLLRPYVQRQTGAV